jgi:hypothetical protein
MSMSFDFGVPNRCGSICQGVHVVHVIVDGGCAPEPIFPRLTGPQPSMRPLN